MNLKPFPVITFLTLHDYLKILDVITMNTSDSLEKREIHYFEAFPIPITLDSVAWVYDYLVY